MECSERGLWWASFVVIGALTTVWSLSTPIYHGSDEQEHTIKAVAVARGQLQTATVDEPGPWGISIPQTRVDVPEAYATLEDAASCWAPPLTPAGERPPNGVVRTGATQGDGCVPPTRDGETVTLTTYVGTYPPTYYALVGWPSVLLPPDLAFFAMRIVSGLLSAAFLASALTSAAVLRGARLLVPATALGVTPGVLYLSGSINPNGLEVAAACAAFASTLALLTVRGTLSHRLLLRTALAIAALACIRSLGPVFALCTVVTALLVAGDHATVQRLWADRTVRRAATIVAAAIAGAVVFTAVVGTEVMTAPAEAGASSMSLALDHLESLPANQLDAVGQVGVIAWQVTEVPPMLAWAWIGAVVLLAAAAVVVGGRRGRVAILLLVAATAGLPVVAQLVSDQRILWFGRYTLAVTAGLSVVGAYVVGRSPKVQGSVLAAAGSILAVGIGAAHALGVERQLRIVEQVAETLPWSGPADQTLLLAVGLIAAALYGGLLLLLALGRLRTPPLAHGEVTLPGPAEDPRVAQPSGAPSVASRPDLVGPRLRPR